MISADETMVDGIPVSEIPPESDLEDPLKTPRADRMPEPRDLLLADIDAFDPFDPSRSISILLQWKANFNGTRGFFKLFQETRGLERVVEKLISVSSKFFSSDASNPANMGGMAGSGTGISGGGPNMGSVSGVGLGGGGVGPSAPSSLRHLKCRSYLLDIFHLTLQGSPDYHDWLLDSIMDIATSVGFFGKNTPKANDLRRVVTKHILSLLHVQAKQPSAPDGPGTGPSGSSSSKNSPNERGRGGKSRRKKGSSSSGSNANNSLSSTKSNILMKVAIQPSSMLSHDDKETSETMLLAKLRELDGMAINVNRQYRKLREQMQRLEDMRPASDPKFKSVYDAVNNDVKRRNHLLNQKQTQLGSEMERQKRMQKEIESKIAQQCTPLENDLRRLENEIQNHLRRKQDYERTLRQVEAELEDAQSRKIDMTKRLNSMKSHYGPAMSKLSSTFTDKQFEAKNVEKEGECFSQLSRLTNESWQKLESWSQKRIDMYQSNSDVHQRTYLTELSNYLQAYAKVVSFLRSRVDALNTHINRARGTRAGLQPYFASQVTEPALQEIDTYEMQIKLDERVRQKTERDIYNILKNSQNMVRPDLFLEFLESLTYHTNDELNLRPFVESANFTPIISHHSHHGSVQGHAPSSGTRLLSSSATGSGGNVNVGVGVGVGGPSGRPTGGQPPVVPSSSSVSGRPTSTQSYGPRGAMMTLPSSQQPQPPTVGVMRGGGGGPPPPNTSIRGNPVMVPRPEAPVMNFSSRRRHQKSIATNTQGRMAVMNGGKTAPVPVMQSQGGGGGGGGAGNPSSQQGQQVASRGYGHHP